MTDLTKEDMIQQILDASDDLIDSLPLDEKRRILNQLIKTDKNKFYRHINAETIDFLYKKLCTTFKQKKIKALLQEKQELISRLQRIEYELFNLNIATKTLVEFKLECLNNVGIPRITKYLADDLTNEQYTELIYELLENVTNLNTHDVRYIYNKMF